jgi:hypothetical protein
MRKVRLTVIICVSFVVLAAGITLAQKNAGDAMLKLLETAYAPPEPLLPVSLKKEAAYQEGGNTQVGIVDFVENEAYVIHADKPDVAYKAEKTKPVSVDDTLVCDEGSRLTVLLKDQSQIVMAPYSKIVLAKVDYDPDSKARDTVVKMGAGAARFVVAKLNATKEDFNVVTPSATCGVRGSDFVVALVPEDVIKKVKLSLLDDLFSPRSALAQIIDTQQNLGTLTLAGPGTTLHVSNPFGSVILTSNTVTVTHLNLPPSPAVSVTPSYATGLLGHVGPHTSNMSMPSVFE